MSEKEIEYILYHEGSEIEEFAIDGYNFRKLLLQLQAHKDKEDKLREYIEHNDFSDWHIGQDKDQFRKNDLLKILDGRDE